MEREGSSQTSKRLAPAGERETPETMSSLLGGPGQAVKGGAPQSSAPGISNTYYGKSRSHKWLQRAWCRKKNKNPATVIKNVHWHSASVVGEITEAEWVYGKQDR